MNQVSFGNGVPTMIQAALQPTSAQSTAFESEIDIVTEISSQSITDGSCAQATDALSSAAQTASPDKQAASVEISEEGWNAIEDYNQSAIEYSMQLLERLQESRRSSTSKKTKTSCPRSSVNLLATGAKESSGFGSPFGLPRWEQRITFPPSAISFLMVGSAATRRFSSVIFKSASNGTLKSQRTNTFLPFTLISSTDFLFNILTSFLCTDHFITDDDSCTQLSSVF